MVNWVDGMKVRQEDFTTMENALLERVQRTAASILNEHNYGLLGMRSLPEKNLHLQFKTDPHCCVLQLYTCQAITAAGMLIQFPLVTTEGRVISDSLVFHWQTPKQDGVWYVIIHTDYYQRIPAGDPVPDVLPCRTKYTMDRLLLSMVATQDIPVEGLLPGQLTIGRVVVKNHMAEVDQGYIPPCISIGAHPLLMVIGEEVMVLLRQVRCSCQEIIEKIYSRNQQQEMAAIILYLAEHVGQVLSWSLPFYQDKVGQDSPFHLFTLAKTTGGVWLSALEQRASGSREEILQYFAEWSGVPAGEIETKCYDLVVATYHHVDMQTAFHSALSFLRIMQRVFAAIGKLEYIGKKPDGNIFVKEEGLGQPPIATGTRKSKWSFSE
ncbi:type VI secretion system (T6SS) EvfL/ImpJ/VasE family protein [Chitinophaga dinghuensis]|uniref:Type VI secretion system (T6SS) EvfL/ImpJ/VasE family protein n=2 Tax=Chitinophaga dinghuensis TaxID=1539050 RepID=A0A327W569_9BACT|nr:type VI secretion system (T6SS) EvfL/ImpJ/VasE family protein [Chitinophaga dinghuensis]